MGDSDPAATFGYVAKELGKRQIAFIFTREHFNAPALTPALKQAFGGTEAPDTGDDGCGCVHMCFDFFPERCHFRTRKLSA
jgi:hypothetical protein